MKKMKKTIAVFLALCSCFAFAACDSSSSESSGPSSSPSESSSSSQPSGDEDTPVETTVTAEEWLAALSFAGVDNYKLVSEGTNMRQTVDYNNGAVHTVSYMGGELMLDGYLVKDGDKYYSVNADTGEREECTKAEYDNVRTVGIDTTFLYADFAFDEESKTYKADEVSFPIGDGMTMRYTNLEVTFENKRIVKMTYQAENPYIGTEEGVMVVTYGNAETIVLPNP